MPCRCCCKPRRRSRPVTLHLKERLRSVHELPDGVSVLTETGHTHVADALIGCDGLWSVVRRHVMAGPAGLQPDADPPA